MAQSYGSEFRTPPIREESCLIPLIFPGEYPSGRHAIIFPAANICVISINSNGFEGNDRIDRGQRETGADVIAKRPLSRRRDEQCVNYDLTVISSFFLDFGCVANLLYAR